MDQNCISKALILNLWKTPADLINVTQEDMKTILVEELSKHLDNQEHSLQDLSGRSIITHIVSKIILLKIKNLQGCK